MRNKGQGYGGMEAQLGQGKEVLAPTIIPAHILSHPSFGNNCQSESFHELGIITAVVGVLINCALACHSENHAVLRADDVGLCLKNDSTSSPSSQMYDKRDG